MGLYLLDHVWTSKQPMVISQRFVQRSYSVYAAREYLSTAGKVEDKSCWPNRSRAHFLPPAWWDEVNWSCSRLIFNQKLLLKHGVHLNHSSNRLCLCTDLKRKWSLSLEGSYFGCVFKVQTLFSHVIWCIPKWWKQRQNGVSDICKNHKCFTGKTWIRIA